MNVFNICTNPHISFYLYNVYYHIIGYIYDNIVLDIGEYMSYIVLLYEQLKRNMFEHKNESKTRISVGPKFIRWQQTCLTVKGNNMSVLS